MPYCTIQEAWGNMKIMNNDDMGKKIKNNYHNQNHHVQDKQEDKMPEIIVPENSYDFQNMYNHVEYPSVNYDNQVLSVYPNTINKDPPKHVSFNRISNVSRSMMKPLDNHNPNENLVKQNNNYHIINNQNVSPVETQSFRDNHIEKREFQPKNKKDIQPFIESDDESDDESMESTEIVESREQTNKLNDMMNYIKKLEKQNKRLKRLLKKRQNNKSNLFDLLLYIISGIFIIFILDSFIRLLTKKSTN